jgi:hypothetical protein
MSREGAQRADVDLADWLATNYERVRQLPDGSFAALSGLAFTTGVYLGVTRWGYERRYCFVSRAEALAALDALQSEDDEPAGWIARRPETAADRQAKSRPGYRGGKPEGDT